MGELQEAIDQCEKMTTVLMQPPVRKRHFMMTLCKLKTMLAALYDNVGYIGHGEPWSSQSSYGLKMG